GISRQAVAGAKNGLVAQAIGEPHARGEARLARLEAAVLRDRPDSAEQHLSGIHVEALDPAIGTSGNREVLPANAVIDGEPVGRGPAVPSIGAEQAGPYVIFVRDLERPTGAAGLADHESRNAVVPGAGGDLLAVPGHGIDALAAQRDASVEAESSLRAEAAGDELGLRLVQRHLVQFAAEPDVVPPLYQVEVHHVLRLRVAAVVRHGVFVEPPPGEVLGIWTEFERRPAALEST